MPVFIFIGGAAGSARPMCLKMQGIDSAVIGRVPLPHYHIGESLSGDCGVHSDLGLEAEINKLNFTVKVEPTSPVRRSQCR